GARLGQAERQGAADAGRSTDHDGGAVLQAEFVIGHGSGPDSELDVEARTAIAEVSLHAARLVAALHFHCVVALEAAQLELPAGIRAALLRRAPFAEHQIAVGLTPGLEGPVRAVHDGV